MTDEIETTLEDNPGDRDAGIYVIAVDDAVTDFAAGIRFEPGFEVRVAEISPFLKAQEAAGKVIIDIVEV